MSEESQNNSNSATHAVFFAEKISHPENMLKNMLCSLKENYQHVQHAFIVATFELDEHWLQKKQNLKVTYQVLFDTHNRNFYIPSFVIQPVLSLIIENCIQSLGREEKIQEQDTNNLIPITVYFNHFLFNNIKNDFEKKEKQKVCIKPKEFFFFEPVFIPKPWGQEIWFTGVEKRGVSKVFTHENPASSLPLPWVFSCYPQGLLGQEHKEKNLTLVKILDPIADEVYGDLYYELHTEKNEVYVVTDIATDFGKIKFGINPEKLNEYSSNINEFKIHFQNAIHEYESVRRKIDKIFDQYREENQIPLNEPIASEQIKAWSARLPENLILEEKEKRVLMDSFAGYIHLTIGDVIRVPTLVPHALQHGVKVIEFQTPTYERMIISFAQKVLTQPYWDTAKAFDKMKILPPQKTTLEILVENEDYCEERVCSFQEFQSSRFKLKSQKTVMLKPSLSYRLLFHVHGNLHLSTQETEKIEVLTGRCIFLPPHNNYFLTSKTEVTFLICTPN
ncbi:hypothetical protein [Silvanigrella aquatica]|uniref:Mannose-6-phosphate isomerase n=1 Tax=Silvanigrella aquatica TaxID=1915309 RepID=A0A1L4D083_9BACT|nr:hypothetical protein [Silvanigrella aquatica]APJ03609.1 hypothetical protein AXG55_06690 [Silvanigrella aquatica]